MTSIDTITLEVPDLATAEAFYAAAFGLGDRVGVRAGEVSSGDGFRGFSLSAIVSKPADVDAVADRAIDAGATVLKPVRRSLWGYGGVLRAPDGAIWKVATSKKKDIGTDTGGIDDVVLLLGASDILASKRFYLERGLEVARSFGRRYVEFAAPPGAIKLALYGRRGLAKDLGVPEEPAPSHRLIINGGEAAFADPDGFAWEPAASRDLVGAQVAGA